MRKAKFILSFIFAVLLLMSCSEPTMQEDAQKAAELAAISNNYAMNSDFEKSRKVYQEVQVIIEKYKKLDQFEEFYKLYNSYLEFATIQLRGEDTDRDVTE